MSLIRLSRIRTDIMHKININPHAMRRVEHPIKPPKKYFNCNSKVVLQHADDVFGRALGTWPWLYICTRCNCRVGTHPGTDIPMGTLADHETRKARQISKSLFIDWAKRNNYSQTRRYELLSSMLDIKITKCHFAMFDLDTCKSVIQLLTRH
ncbi:hypothetical protein CTM88_18170 [Photobacterium aquimaris]|uniref:Uncharacterized protein n=2 Tax=Photobacterium aquimaris TaxID=512643 RepID=A0A2T3IFQ3_9GAMM|nr:hypothetical protein CTM88_18170 [Photobacterium aquimaris]